MSSGHTNGNANKTQDEGQQQRQPQVVIVRHGESEFNSSNIFCGWQDAPLSTKGIADTKEIAAANLKKANLEFDCVYTSVLERAWKTAQIIIKELGLPAESLVKDWRLNERHYGALTGYNKRKMAEKYTEEKVQTYRRNYSMRPPAMEESHDFYKSIRDNEAIPAEAWSSPGASGESMEDTYKRIMPLWAEIKAKIMTGKRVLIVAHGTVARSLAKEIECISDKDIEKLNIPNSVPFIYKFDGNGKLISGPEYLADKDFVEEKAKQVAEIGN